MRRPICCANWKKAAARLSPRRAAAEQARIEAQMLRRRYAEELSNLEALRREARQKAQEEARALLKRAQDKVDNTLAEVAPRPDRGQADRARPAEDQRHRQ